MEMTKYLFLLHGLCLLFLDDVHHDRTDQHHTGDDLLPVRLKVDIGKPRFQQTDDKYTKQ